MDSLSVYIPMDRRFALHRGVPLPEHSRGAALFADVSGFTPLTVAYAEELGRLRGAEEIIRQLNRVYTALIDQIHYYGGSIIGFSGDGLTCWFDRATDSADNATRRATACALTIQETMGKLGQVVTPEGTAVSLSVKVAVTAGGVRRFLVGLPHIRRLEVLAGATTMRMGVAENLAQQGEVIVGAEVISWFGDQLKISEWRQATTGEHFAVISAIQTAVAPSPWPDTPSLLAEVAQSWLLPPVAEQLKRGQADFVAQLRPAAALFLKFEGIDFINDIEAGLKLDTYIRWVQAVLDRYQGSILELTIGEKGSYFYASFGVPLTHEDDTNRAVAAALELQNPPRGLHFNQNVRIGISQGMVRVGAYGSTTRRSFGAQGSEVNLAARLMSRAEPGQILVSPHIAEAVREHYHLRLVETVNLKGIERPVPLFAIEGKQQRRTAVTMETISRQKMVGRHKEKAFLNARLHALQAEEAGCTVIIEGEAGIGKTQLVAALLRSAQAEGVSFYLGGGNQIEQATPYYAWRPVFRELFGLEGDEDRETIWQKVFNNLSYDPELAERVPLLSGILPLSTMDTDTTRQMLGDVRVNNTREFLLRLLADAAKEKPRLVVLEDAHWLDSASWALVEEVKRDVPLVMLVIVTRPLPQAPLNGRSPTERRRIQQAQNVERILLAELPSQEVEELVCQRLEVDVMPRPVVDLIVEKAEGHPFFSEELAYALRDRGLIRVEDGRCYLTTDPAQLQTLDFPDTVQKVITSRIDQLEPSQQLTLKVASVIGRVFAFYTLDAVYPVPIDKPRLPEHLQTLSQLDITRQQTPEPELSYAFKHSITQEVAYNMMLFAQRRDLHQAVAEWYETANLDNLPTWYPLLAHHWSQAEVPIKAITYLEKAAEQALDSGAYSEAIRSFTRLQKMTQAVAKDDIDQVRRARWERQMADACWGMGYIGRYISHAQAALALLGEEEPTTRSSLLANVAGQFSKQMLHVVWPTRFLGRVEMDDRLRELAHVYRQLSQAHYLNNEFLPCYQAGLHYVNLTEMLNESPMALAEAYANTGLGFGSTQMQPLAERYGRKARRLSRQVDSKHTKAYVLLRQGMYYTGLARWQEAQTSLEEAATLSQSINDWRMLADSWHTLGYASIYQGDFGYAHEMGRREYELALRQGNRQQQMWGLHLQAVFYLHLDRVNKAVNLWEQARALYQEGEGSVSEIAATAALGIGYLHQGHYFQAEEIAARVAEQLARSRPFVTFLFDAYTVVPTIYLKLCQDSPEERPRWQPLLQQGVRALGRFARAFPVGRPRYRWLEGELAQMQGKEQKALQAWQKCLAEALRLQMPYDEGLAHLAYGRTLPETDPNQAEHLKQAETIFHQLNALIDLAQVRALQTGK